jgi:hypothetical protein
MTTVSLPPLFPQEDIATIVQDVLDCSTGLKRPGPKCKRPEEELTKQVFNRLVKTDRYRVGPFYAEYDPWLVGLKDRPDIRFSCGRGIECYFLVEAKRLFVTFPGGRKDSLIAEYIDEGVMRFVSRRYAPFQHASAMLGYVHDEPLDSAKQKLCETMKRHGCKLKLKQDIISSALPVTPNVSESTHALSYGDFTLYHLTVAVK